MKIIEKERYEYYWEKEITLIHKSVMIKNGKKKKRPEFVRLLSGSFRFAY